jgi:hypothetical protein
MAFKTFAPGVLTSSDVNTFLMRQAVIVCTSSTRPGSPNEGMTIYETDTDRYKTYSGTAWEDGFKSGAFIAGSATLQSGGAGTDWVLGNGTIDHRFQKVGRFVFHEIKVTFGSTSVFGTKSLSIRISPEVALPSNRLLGYLEAWDESANIRYPGSLFRGASAGGVTDCGLGIFPASGTFTTGDTIINTRPFTWASGDELSMHISYEATT